MKPHLFIERAVPLSSLVLTASSLSPLSSYADDHVSGAMILAPAEKRGVMASGAVEDTLKACLARIPEDASLGQRMVAEYSCQREDETRKLIQVPLQF